MEYINYFLTVRLDSSSKRDNHFFFTIYNCKMLSLAFRFQQKTAAASADARRIVFDAKAALIRSPNFDFEIVFISITSIIEHYRFGIEFNEPRFCFFDGAVHSVDCEMWIH